MTDPIVEKTTIEKASGEAALTQQPAPAPAADDNLRGWLAIITSIAYGIFVCIVIWLLVFYSEKISPVEATLMGTIIGNQSANVQSVYQYYYGSSSGSTAKDKRP